MRVNIALFIKLQS